MSQTIVETVSQTMVETMSQTIVETMSQTMVETMSQTMVEKAPGSSSRTSSALAILAREPLEGCRQ